MTVKKVQLYLDRDKTIEASPETSAKYVTLSDGNDLQKVLDNDLTTPTVVHEETSFKVGVGDVNVSSSVVDGEVGRMVIKGKTYQNILPEPSTPVLTNNKEMFKVNEGLDPNVEVVDGISKSAILSGQTLVNLSGQLTHHEKWVETGDDLVLNLPSGNGQPHINVGLVYKLKKDTIYTVVINMKLYETGYPHICFMDESNRQLASDREWTPSSTGVLKTTFTTSSTVEASILRIIPRNGIDNIYTIGKKIIILEGDYTNQDIPYFEGMSSCKMPVLTTVGKNLFNYLSYQEKKDYTKYEPEKIIINSPTQFLPTQYDLFLEEGKTYVISCEKTSGAEISVRRSDGSSLLYATTSTNCKKVFVAENNTFLRLSNREIINEDVWFSNIQIEEGSTATPYEPFKSNILHTPEEITLKGIGDVRDTLNCNTGEYVERVKEIVLNGSGSEDWQGSSSVNGSDDLIRFYTGNGLGVVASTTGNFYCDKVKVVDNRNVGSSSGECVFNNSTTGSFPNGIQFQVSKDKATTLAEWKQYLSQNPITVQYPVTTPIVKTVDLSSSGNWEKVVLDGSEDIVKHGSTFTYYSYGSSTIDNVLPYASGGRAFASHILTGSTGESNLVTSCKYTVAPKVTGTTGLCFSLDGSMTVEEAKVFLQQNPITVWYQTQTHQDSTQVKQSIFFKDGHIQLSSGAENSLIPTLDYEAKTSNSYVMDLMKTNTTYTVKATQASGKYTLNGNEYHLVGNGTINSGSGANFLVITQGSATDLMFLEGNLKNKTIPYFKGIKSAFEDEDKIEVLSTGKNLFDGELEMATIGTSAGEKRPSTSHVCSVNFIKVKPSSAVILTNNNGYIGVIHEYDKNYNYIKYTSSATEITKTTLTADTEYVLIRTTDASKATDLSTKFLLEVANSKTDYEPHKSNNTKIPLLSPLRSLPNGVSDELIINRAKNKATLIQRIGYSVINSEFAKNGAVWNNTKDTDPCFGFHCGNYVQGTNMVFNQSNTINNILPFGAMSTTGRPLIGYYKTNPHLAVNRNEASTLDMAKKWLDRNPINLYYQLETPIVTEIDLESFPLVYKDGHIFLNSEIAPVIEIDYNVNQAQQIQANNETLQRHELDILDLDNLIVSFVNAEYNLRLLKFDMELSMMALAE